MQNGLVALYQKCPHLGCRVPQCVSSQWFECPCHGSQYNRVGEKKGGPAPRGMDRFILSVSNAGDVVIDTGTVFPGPPIGVNTTGQEAEGPHCIGASGGPLMIALATTAIGWVILVLSLLGWVIYYFGNRNAARPELGSEIELAANRGRTTSTTRSSKVAPRPSCRSSVCCCSSRWSSACRCTGSWSRTG